MPSQLDEEFKVIDLVLYVFGSLGFEDFTAQVSLRDPEKTRSTLAQRRDLAENAIINAAKEKNLNYVIEYGEAAFYGPKLDFMVKDALGRKWQLGTIQVAYLNALTWPIRAVIMSCIVLWWFTVHPLEFKAICCHFTRTYRREFPTLVNAEQVIILSVSEKYEKYAEKVSNQLKNSEIRALIDNRNETIGKKIREAQLNKFPYMLIVGEKEAAENTVAVRNRVEGDTGSITIETFIEKIQAEIEASSSKFEV